MLYLKIRSFNQNAELLRRPLLPMPKLGLKLFAEDECKIIVD